MGDIPLAEVNPLIRIANQQIYQLLEDSEEEIWRLYVTDIPAR